MYAKMNNSFNYAHADHDSRVSPIATTAGSISGTFIILCILSLMVVISVVICLKRRQKVFNLTSNVAYAGQSINEDIDYDSISQPPAGTNGEMKDEHLVTLVTLTAAKLNESAKDQRLYETIDKCQPTTDVPKTNEEVLRRSIERHTENDFSQPSSVLYHTIDENTTGVLQSGSSPAVLSVIEVQSEIKAEPELPITTVNVAYIVSSYSSGVDLEAQQPCEGSVNLVQNVAYKPTVVPLSPNVAYESHDYVHLGTENQDEYEYELL